MARGQKEEAPKQVEQEPMEPMPEPTVSEPTPNEGEIPVGRNSAVVTQLGKVRTKNGVVKLFESKFRHPASKNVHTSRFSE